ncbi:MAG: efflux RND transporter periplasmic adaptor subunit [Myxococcota bacterium]
MKKSLVFLGLFACSTPAAEPQPPPTEGLPKAAELRFVPSGSGQEAALLEVPAEVRATGGDAKISALDRALIRQISARPGDQVRAGQGVLTLVEPELIRAVSALSSAELRATALSDRRAQLLSLQQEGLVKREQLFEVERELASVEASRVESQAILRSRGIDREEALRIQSTGAQVVRAPVGGVITSIAAAVGAVAEPGTVLLEIRGTAEARVELVLARPLPAEVKAEWVDLSGKRGALQLPPLARAPLPRGAGDRVWLAFAEPTQLVDGLAGKVVFHLGRGARSVPARAVLGGAESPAVFVRNAQGRPERRPVSLLLSSPSVAIVRGLEADEWVAQDAERAAEGVPQ